jgi:hypothetical protein
VDKFRKGDAGLRRAKPNWGNMYVNMYPQFPEVSTVHSLHTQPPQPTHFPSHHLLRVWTSARKLSLPSLIFLLKPHTHTPPASFRPDMRDNMAWCDRAPLAHSHRAATNLLSAGRPDQLIVHVCHRRVQAGIAGSHHSHQNRLYFTSGGNA